MSSHLGENEQGIKLRQSCAVPFDIFQMKHFTFSFSFCFHYFYFEEQYSCIIKKQNQIEHDAIVKMKSMD